MPKFLWRKDDCTESTRRTETGRRHKELLHLGCFPQPIHIAGAVWTVAGALSHAFQWEYPRYFPFALALIFAVIGDFVAKNKDALVKRSILWFLNGCLIYTTAVGGDEVAGGSRDKKKVEDVKAQTQELKQDIRATLPSMPAASRPEALRVQAEIQRLQSCLNQEEVERCAEEHPIQNLVFLSRPTSASATSVLENIQREALMVNKDLKVAAGEIGFGRISGVLQ
jgi:hypothetical protein